MSAIAFNQISDLYDQVKLIKTYGTLVHSRNVPEGWIGADIYDMGVYFVEVRYHAMSYGIRGVKSLITNEDWQGYCDSVSIGELEDLLI